MGRRSLKSNNNSHYAPSQKQQNQHKNSNPVIQLPRSWDYMERFREPYFFPFKSKMIEIKQSPKGPYIGSCVWDTSIVMSKYFELKMGSNAFKGKRIIELGSGVGLAGIILSLLGADIILTDQKNMHEILEHNVNLNCQPLTTTKVDELWWGSDVSRYNPPYDMIIGSDLVYEDHCIDILLKSLIDLSSYHPKKKKTNIEKIEEQLDSIKISDDDDDNKNKGEEKKGEDEEEIVDDVSSDSSCDFDYTPTKITDEFITDLDKAFLLPASDTEIYFGYENRDMVAESIFFSKVHKYFNVETIHTKDLNPGFEAVDIRILKMTRKPAPTTIENNQSPSTSTTISTTTATTTVITEPNLLDDKE